MNFSSVFIKTPKDWITLTNAVMALTRNLATDVRYVGDAENLSADKSVVDVIVMQLHGDADYALEIYWKGMSTLADDAVGMYLARALGSPVIVSDDRLRSSSWLLIQPDGCIENIHVDIAKLDEHSIVEYKVV